MQINSSDYIPTQVGRVSASRVSVPRCTPSKRLDSESSRLPGWRFDLCQCALRMGGMKYNCKMRVT